MKEVLVRKKALRYITKILFIRIRIFVTMWQRIESNEERKLGLEYDS